jgi:CHAT domain-containing protein
MQPKQIAIGGEKQLPPIEPPVNAQGLWLKATYRVDSTTRGITTEKHQLTLNNNDLLELEFSDGSTWMVDRNTMDDVFPTANTRSDSQVFDIPPVITTSDRDRGILSTIALTVVRHFVKNSLDQKVVDIATAFEDKALGNKPGLYRLDAGFNFLPLNAMDKDKPYLLFLHGTGSSTTGSFGELKGGKLWAYISQTYGNNVLALQHRTLTVSPLQNVLELVQQLPDMISLHLITHSRGGLVGEILSRFCITDEGTNGFSDDEIALLNKLDRDEDVKNIMAIRDAMKTKKISVRKFVRVACPAAGTTLASNRMDRFFNVLGNLLPASIDVLKELIAAILATKNDNEVLPGLEAMDPASPFIKVLNNASFSGTVSAPLMVISGNCQLSLSLKAFVVIMSKLFYLRDNDLIVNTGSMYQGTKRPTIQYFFDQGANVNHFHYFMNESTQQMIQQALEYAGDGLVPGFQYMSAAEAAASRGLEGGPLFMDTVTGKRPIAVILPGIMGSNLSIDNDVNWINYLRFIKGKLTQLRMDTPDVTAPSIVATSYRKLAEFLGDTYDVVTFPFDWRQQLNDSAALFNDKILKLLGYNQPIKIIGHSMGGVLVRDFILMHPDTWQKLNASKGFRLLFLGSPLGGSFRIPYVLFGQDAIISKLAMIDIFHTKKELLQVFSQMPGILSLLPVTTDKDNDMADLGVWQKMRTAFGSPDWPLPAQTLLDAFKKYRDFINQESCNIDFGNAVYIAGKDKQTTCGYEIRDGELYFLSTGEGDQSVTWATGIPPQMTAKDAVYYVDVTHGALANERSIFNGIADILANGSTRLLSKVRPAVRGDEKVFPTMPGADFDMSAVGVENTILGLDSTTTFEQSEVPLNVSISQGDLSYASFPILIGHFNGDGILYAEKAVDHYLDGRLSRRHKLGLYPGLIGTSEILLGHPPNTSGAVVVGMGSAGDLTAYQLARTIEQGVANYLLRMDSQASTSGEIGLSPLIIGCGYGGLTIENSVRAILQGIQNANAKIKKLQDNKIRPVTHVEFIEKYDHRALAAYYALNTLENENCKSFNIRISNRKIKTLFGLERHSVLKDTDEWWNRINVQLVKKDDDRPTIKCLQFSSSTGAAREEQRKLYSSIDIISSLIAEISNSDQWTAETAKTVFELLIPNDFKEQLKKQCNINWILDKDTAGYPWELLHDGAEDNYPLSVSAGMIRQLATQDYRLTINAVTKKNALVIGDPVTSGFLKALPAAEKEGIEVTNILKANGFTPTSMIKSSSFEIIKALFASAYRIIHIAGHGVFNEDNPESSGIVIGKGVFLSTREIAQMSNIPELVFVNCCSLGAVDAVAEEFSQNRYKLAANIGVQLIENGAKVVVAAGWPVSDDAAMEFTATFYQLMFAGYNFGESIRRARKLIFEKYPRSNTWGAYQCYGDPFFKLVDHEHQQEKDNTSYVIAQEAEDDLFNLFNRLQTGNTPLETYLDELAHISAAIDIADIRTASITEKEAMIYTELAVYDKAAAKFEELFALEKAEYSVCAVETYIQVRCQKCMADYFLYPGEQKKLELQKNMQEVLAYLEKLNALTETAVRFNLLGLAYKTQAFISDDHIPDMRIAAGKYRLGYLKKPNGNMLNSWVRLELLLKLAGNKPSVEDGYEVDFDALEKMLHEQVQTFKESADVMNYWDTVMLLNYKVTLLMLHPPAQDNDPLLQEVAASMQNLKGGSIGKKATEKEHLRFVVTALSWFKDPSMTCLSNMLESVLKEW